MTDEEHDRQYWTAGMPEQEVREGYYDLLKKLEAAPKAPHDMNLRELFDHVAIVNDAIRAALLTHPGMTPPKSEG